MDDRSDFRTCLPAFRNAQMAEKVSVAVPASKMKRAVLEVLKAEGYIEGFAEQAVDGKRC